MLRLLADGRLPQDASTADALRGPAAVTLLDAGAATWRHSWTGPAHLADREGNPVDLDPAPAPA